MELNLSAMELDALNEVGNIGTGNAATALAKFLSKSVDMNIPESKFIPITEFANEFGGPEKLISTIYLEVSGGLTGEVMFIFPFEGALELLDIIMGRNVGETKEMTDMDESAFKEIANILAGAFLSSLSNMLDKSILPSIPHTATDMAQAVLDFILVKMSRHADQIFCIKTKINLEGHNINGDFIFIFDDGSLKTMLNTLHEKYGDLK